MPSLQNLQVPETAWVTKYTNIDEKQIALPDSIKNYIKENKIDTTYAPISISVLYLYLYPSLSYIYLSTSSLPLYSPFIFTMFKIMFFVIFILGK